MFKSLVLLVSIIMAGYFVRDGLIKFRSYERVVDVRGLSERVVKSNEAVWSLSFSVNGNELQTMNASYKKNQTQMIDFLKNLGFKETEIQKSAASFTDNWANLYGNQKPSFRYTLRGSVTVSTTNVDAIASALDKTDSLLASGIALENSNAKYYFTDLNKIKPDMVKEATESAKESATKFAEHSSSKLGNIKNASQGLFTITDENSDYGSESKINKKVRVVTQVSFFLE